jgi:single-stranded DNA-binding protein
MQVFVQGRLQMRAYEDKSGVKRLAVDLVASTVQLLDKRTTSAATNTTPHTLAEDYDPFLNDDELPA